MSNYTVEINVTMSMKEALKVGFTLGTGIYLGYQVLRSFDIGLGKALNESRKKVKNHEKRTNDTTEQNA